MSDLFLVSCGEKETSDEEYSSAYQAARNGAAGQFLVVGDLLIRGFCASIMEGSNADIVAEINGTIRRIQVKSSTTGSFGPGGAHHRKDGTESKWGKPLNAYESIDAFSFVYLPRRLVYYVAAQAISSRSLTIPNMNKQACDLSFVELQRRWSQAA